MEQPAKGLVIYYGLVTDIHIYCTEALIQWSTIG